MTPQIDRALHSVWRELCNGANRIEGVQLVIEELRDQEVLTPDYAELWVRRIQVCPGHFDGRSWCAYCGELRKEATP